MSDVRPSDITIVLATACAGQARWASGDGWTDAAAVADFLDRLGFPTSPQRAAGLLARVARLEAPPVVVRKDGRWNAYYVTGFGRTWVENLLPGVDLQGDYLHPSQLVSVSSESGSTT